MRLPANNGVPGIDGVTFEAIEAGGLDVFIEQLHQELAEGTYHPLRLCEKIPKGGGGSRGLSIPTIRDRVVQGAVKLIGRSTRWPTGSGTADARNHR